MHDLSARGRQAMSGSTMLMLFAAAAALLVIFSAAPRGAPDPSRVAVIASVGLTDDDGGQGMFNSSRLVPGESVTECIKVSSGKTTPGGTVYLSAADVAGQLAPDLRIKVEQGSGGSADSCGGFEPASVVYDGFLPGLADPDPAAPRTPTGWHPGASDTRTYRITATLAETSTAQAKNSTATFTWFVVGAPTAEPSVEPSPERTEPAPPAAAPTSDAPAAATEPSAEPTTTPSDPPVAVAQEPARGRSARPVASSAAPAAAQRSAAPTRPAGGKSSQAATPAAEKKPIAKIREAITKMTKEFAEVAMRSSERGAPSMVGFAGVLAFLTLQNRIDRLDPKLALAPMKDPHLVFAQPDADPTSAARREEDA